VSGARGEARVITTTVALLCGAAVVTAYLPQVEHVLDVAACWLGGVVLAGYVWLIVRDTWL
jgi:hypothetical protein